jgi:hypothetical protein
MFAWIEAGQSNTYLSVNPKDVVFRTATLSNSIVIGNSTNAGEHAALYVQQNMVGIRQPPMQGLGLDVKGNLGVSQSLKVYDDVTDDRSNFATLRSNHVHCTHSNLSLISPAGQKNVHLAATGVAAMDTLVSQRMCSVVGGFSNVVIQGNSSNNADIVLNVLDDEDALMRVAAEAYTRVGSQLSIGDTLYDIVASCPASNASLLSLRTVSPDGLQVQDDLIRGQSSVVDIKILADEHAHPWASGAWDPAAPVLEDCDVQPAPDAGGRVLRISCDSVPDALFRHLRRLCGTYVAMGKRPAAPPASLSRKTAGLLNDFRYGRFSVVRVVNVTFGEGAETQEVAVDVAGLDMSPEFSNAVTERLQLGAGSDIVLRRLTCPPDLPVERDLLLDPSSSVQAIEFITRPVRNSTMVGEQESSVKVTFVISSDLDVQTLTVALPASAASGANAIVRASVLVADTSARMSVTESWFDPSTQRLTLEGLGPGVVEAWTAIHATDPTPSATLRLRVFGEKVPVTAARMLDAHRSLVTVSAHTDGAAAFLAELQRTAAKALSFSVLCGVFGADCAALRPLEVSHTPQTSQSVVTFSRSDRLAHSIRGTLFAASQTYDARAALFTPTLEVALQGSQRLRLAPGACIGQFGAPAGRPASLCVDGDILVQNSLHFVDGYASAADMRMEFSSNVMSLSFAPSLVPHESVARASQPFMTLSTSNVHLRMPLVVDEQVTARHVRTTSDARLKRNIEPSSAAQDLSTLLSIPVCRFEFVSICPASSDATRHVGVIAQEVERVMPSAVAKSPGLIALGQSPVDDNNPVEGGTTNKTDNEKDEKHRLWTVVSCPAPGSIVRLVDQNGQALRIWNELATGDVLQVQVLDANSDSYSVSTNHVDSTTTLRIIAKPQAGMLDVSAAATGDNKALHAGHKVRILGKQTELNVIDTTELLCLTMSAVQQLHAEVAELRNKLSSVATI